MPPVAIGEVMRAGGVGEVVVSNSADHPIGGLVVGHTGWQDHAVASASAPMRAVAEIPGVSPSHDAEPRRRGSQLTARGR